jgi:hypothetical protein
MEFATRPSVLFVYFTYTNQTRKVIDAMAEVLRGRDFDVTLAAIEFTDPRYAGRFKEFPMRHPFRELVGMIPAESPRRRPAKPHGSWAAIHSPSPSAAAGTGGTT